jgi:hypothetical protein
MGLQADPDSRRGAPGGAVAGGVNAPSNWFGFNAYNPSSKSGILYGACQESLIYVKNTWYGYVSVKGERFYQKEFRNKLNLETR